MIKEFIFEHLCLDRIVWYLYLKISLKPVTSSHTKALYDEEEF